MNGANERQLELRAMKHMPNKVIANGIWDLNIIVQNVGVMAFSWQCDFVMTGQFQIYQICVQRILLDLRYHI